MLECRPSSLALELPARLRLCRPGISQQQHVDVTTDPVLGVHVLGAPTEEAQRDGRLHVLTAINGRRYGANNPPSNLR